MGGKSDEEDDEEDDDNMPKATPKKAVKKAPVSDSSSPVYKEDEVPWHPRTTVHSYVANGFQRERVLVETPGGFDGSPNSMKALIDKSDEEFALKLPPQEAFFDPSIVHGYHAQKYGIVYSKDLSAEQSFKESVHVGDLKKKFSTFRHRMPWKGEPSHDLGYPWIDFVTLKTKDGKKTPMLLIELKSIKPIHIEERAAVTGLTANTYEPEPAGPSSIDKAVEDHCVQSLIDTLLKQGVPYDTVMSTISAMGVAGKKRDHDSDENEDEFMEGNDTHVDKKSKTNNVLV